MLKTVFCAPNVPPAPLHASLKRSARSGAPPSTPTTACRSLGPAKRDVANARPQDTDNMRDHLRLHAKKRGPGHRWWSVPCTGVGERLHELKGFNTPPASRLQCHHDEAASVPFSQLSVFALLVDPSSVACDAVFSCCSRPWVTITRERTAQSDVHC